MDAFFRCDNGADRRSFQTYKGWKIPSMDQAYVRSGSNLQVFLIFSGRILQICPMDFKVAWMVITYLLWGSVFLHSNQYFRTVLWLPLFSAEPNDRASLSTWRTIGSTLASLVIGAGTPLVAYVTVDGNPVLSGSRMTIIAGIFSVCAVICYVLCFKLVRERVPVPANNQKFDLAALGKNLITNRALVGIIVAALLLLLAMLGMQGMAGYVFPNYYRSAGAQSAVSLLSNIAVLVICAPLAGKLAARFGKKELSAAACLIGAVSYLLCLIIHPDNVWVYIAFYVLAFIGLGLFNMVIWAMITDVIDDAEVKNGVREDGTIYSVYSFARKLGQAFSSGMVGGLLSLIGYSQATAFDPVVTEGIFKISCIVPIIGLTAVALALIFLYPLNKKRVEENSKELARRRGEK